jgi:hypothetical protein
MISMRLEKSARLLDRIFRRAIAGDARFVEFFFGGPKGAEERNDGAAEHGISRRKLECVLAGDAGFLEDGIGEGAGEIGEEFVGLGAAHARNVEAVGAGEPDKEVGRNRTLIALYEVHIRRRNPKV